MLLIYRRMASYSTLKYNSNLNSTISSEYQMQKRVIVFFFCHFMKSDYTDYTNAGLIMKCHKASTLDFGSYRIGEQRRLRRVCTYVQTRLSIRCLDIQSMDVDKWLNQSLDLYLCMGFIGGLCAYAKRTLYPYQVTLWTYVWQSDFAPSPPNLTRALARRIKIPLALSLQTICPKSFVGLRKTIMRAITVTLL